MFRAKDLVKLGRQLIQGYKKSCDSLCSPWSVPLCSKVNLFSSDNGLKVEEAKRLNWQGRVDLAAAFRGLESMNFHEGICNHLSLVVPASNGDGKVMLMIPYGYHWREAKPDLLVGVNSKGEVVEGQEEVEASAWTIHLGIHKARPDALCVFHLHSPYATALGILKDLPFDMYHQTSCYFYNDFAYDQDYGGLSLDTDEGERIAKHIGNKRVLFMCNHGVVVVGKTVAETFNDTYYIERACMHQALAMSTGRELQRLPEHVIKHTKDQYDLERLYYSKSFFESFKRILDRKE
ncbi:uncharacterized protein LOC116287981 [Actinia tenebrosa]|uniref:Uncharacterized protein LOC116287981 n=1 Tax=Actinia tenebrosa TaxID=6105 RepID=A0A6P8H2D4_ACTTE|nr:uncharacterized protein LOC116287981 [Actinia tenebrosa]